MSNEELIKVYCVVLPDGNSYWVEEGKATDSHIRSFIKAWKESLTNEKRIEYEKAGVTTGVVVIRMLRKDYENLYATNLVDWSKVSA